MLSFEKLDSFFKIDEFATIITRNDTGVSFYGIFGQDVVQLTDTIMNIVSNTLTVTCKSVDVVDLEQDSTLDIDGTTYRVSNISDDKTGITTLSVYKQ